MDTMTTEVTNDLRSSVQAIILNMAEAMGLQVEGELDSSVDPRQGIHALCEILDQFENTLMSQAVWDGLTGTHETKQRLQKHMEAYWAEEFGKAFEQEIKDDSQAGYLGAEGILWKRRIIQMLHEA